MSKQLMLVSGYINIETIEYKTIKENNNKREQTFEMYKERGQKLIDLPIKKIIFIDTKYIDKFQGNEFTRLIPIKLEEMEIYSYYKKIITNGIEIVSLNLNKETVLFHIIQIAKTEFVKKAIEIEKNNINMSSSDIYAWIDFGIAKIFKDEYEFQESVCNITRLLDKIKTNSVKIPGCWKLNFTDINNDFTRVNWYFCGGFFIGYKKVLLEFEKQVKKELEFILDYEKKLTFEVNIWFRLWRKGFVGFDWYYADHDLSLVKNID